MLPLNKLMIATFLILLLQPMSSFAGLADSQQSVSTADGVAKNLVPITSGIFMQSYSGNRFGRAWISLQTEGSTDAQIIFSPDYEQISGAKFTGSMTPSGTLIFAGTDCSRRSGSYSAQITREGLWLSTTMDGRLTTRLLKRISNDPVTRVAPSCIDSRR